MAGRHRVNRDVSVDLPAYTATSLQEKRDGAWRDWMTDDPIYWAAMQRYATLAKGTVIVLGLGLGIVLHHLEQNAAVDRVVVVERQPEVIEMVWPTTPDCELVVGDFFDCMDELPEKADTVIADFWVGSPLTFIDLFLRTYDAVRGKWPEAQGFYHGVDPWVKALESNPPDRRALLISMAEAWV